MTPGRASLCVGALLVLAFAQPPSAQSRGTLAVVAPQSTQTLRDWDVRTQAMLRSGELRARRVDDDALVDGRTHERYDQYYRGVRVFGGDIARQLDAQGIVVSLFGTLYDGIDVSPDPRLDADGVRPIVDALAGLAQPDSRQPELVVLPLRRDGGAVEYRLAWRVRAVTSTADIVQYFLDASSGDVVQQYSDRQTQAAVGRGTGVLGDTKKVSASGTPGNYVARDLLRPARTDTIDFKGDPNRVLAYLNGVTVPDRSDLASDADNVWTDGAIVDAHVYAGLTYDYYFKRFGRHGLDDRNDPVEIIGNPARREDIATNFRLFPDFYVNAFYAGNGIVLFGVGLPAGSTFLGQTVDYFAAAIDIVGHELTHGVTEYTSSLIYRNESGALNEAFSDVMGVSIEFFFQPPGDGLLKADWEQGEDAIRPGGARSLDNPALHGNPDHYSKRYLGTGDNGGVHTNSTIASHAFYLAVEGGTNRTSGLSVQGVGAANREQIERVFYRAFTQLLPSNATFSVARAATIQAARDLYGAGSAAERAVTQAWAAVGVS